jgi:outer membrane protein assembly factor BamA
MVQPTAVMKFSSYRFTIEILAIFIAFFLSSCSNTRILAPGENLLIKNKITFSGKNPGINTDDLSIIAKPKSNQKFLGMARIKLSLFRLGNKGKMNSKFHIWLREKVGERPALYDSVAAKNAAFEMELYLNKVGYFYSGVSYSVKQKKKKKVNVIYLVDPTEPYRLRTAEYAIDDSLMLQFIKKNNTESKIIPGRIYSAFELDDERDRITNILQNNGYYYFNRDFIFFELDSALISHHIDIKVKIKPVTVASAEEPWRVDIQPHKRYFIHNVYIRPDFDPTAPSGSFADTVKFIREYKAARNEGTGDYYILHQPSDHIRSRTVVQSVFIKPGDPFRQTDITRTRSRVAELGIFSYSNIRFKPLTTGESDSAGLLDCSIDLSKRKLHSYTVETELTNSGGRPGIGLNFTYSNNNIFRGSEIFRLKAKGALEAQKVFGDNADYSSGTPFFNTVETGLELSITFPRFLLPVRQERFPKYFRPKTTTSLGFGYETRPEYERWQTNLAFGYDWKESDRKRHQIYPFDWRLNNVTLSPEFEQELEDEPNDLIKNQYTDNMITAIRYTFTYNTQDIRKIQNFFYFKGNLETAGNLMNLGSKLTDANTDSLGHYLLFSIPFAQYIKLDGDFRFFNVITKNNSVAYRLFLGTGIPYGNAELLPLEVGYYGGGANGMRGWPYRLLGPGSYDNPSDNFDRMGDIQLEANIELRFPVYSFIKSALFADIGNIWLISKQESYPGGDFEFNRFYKELAMDVGIGLRLDFNFFILRVDFAIPMRDPANPEDERWVVNKWQFSDIIINFGIGYPF